MEAGIWYWYNKQVSMEVGGLTVHNGVSRVRPIIFSVSHNSQHPECLRANTAAVILVPVSIQLWT